MELKGNINNRIIKINKNIQKIKISNKYIEKINFSIDKVDEN
jgi:hypothetical protein